MLRISWLQLRQKAVCIVCILSLLIVLPVSYAEPRPFTEGDIQTFAVKKFLYDHKIDTLIKYIQWLQKNVVYQKDADGTDTWSSPMATLSKRFGDCEDLSFLNAEVLKLFGFTPQVVGYGHKTYAHVVCLFKIKNTYYMFDNTKLVKTDAKSIEDLAKFFASLNNSTHFFELNYFPKDFKILYKMNTENQA